MKCIFCAVALCCFLGSNVRADEIVLIPTGGQLSWTHFQGPASNVASLTLTAAGFSFQATNQETFGKQWTGLCPINCTGSVNFNGFGTNSFSWSAAADGVTGMASGTIVLFPNNSIPFNPATGFPAPVFTLVFTASGIVVEDTPDRFVFVINNQTLVPEPASVLLLGSGLLSLSGAMLRKRIRPALRLFKGARRGSYQR